MNNLPVKKMAVLHNNANRDFMHLIWKISHYELVTGMEKDIHVSHKGQGAATNSEKGQGITRTRASAAPCKNGLARTLMCRMQNFHNNRLVCVSDPSQKKNVLHMCWWSFNVCYIILCNVPVLVYLMTSYISTINKTKLLFNNKYCQ